MSLLFPEVYIDWVAFEGESNVDQAGGDSVDTFSETKQQSMYTVGIYHNLAPEWLGVVEYSHAEEDWYDKDTSDKEAESDIFSVGMFYLW